MKESIIITVTNEPANADHVQDTALDTLTKMLYRMYNESVDEDGNSGRAA